MPAYFLLGLTLGPSWICKFSLVVLFASRISCGQHECPTTVQMMSESSTAEDHKMPCNRNERVRRLARWFHAVQDIGIVLGAILASIIISCATNQPSCILTQQPFGPAISAATTNGTQADQITPNNANESTSQRTSTVSTEQSATTINQPTKDSIFPSGINLLSYYKESIFNQRDDLLDSLFSTNERGVRICGAGSCPTWADAAIEWNRTTEYNWFNYSGTITLTVFYIALAVIAIALSCFSQHADNTFKYGHFKGITDTILFASPMAYFIGTEQGYVLGGFTRVIASSFIFSLDIMRSLCCTLCNDFNSSADFRRLFRAHLASKWWPVHWSVWL